MTGPHSGTPAALIVFRRPEATRRVLREIGRAQPEILLVIGDGPRDGVAGEAEQVAKARAVIEEVDWDCEVLTNYAEGNMGCNDRVQWAGLGL